MSARGPWAWVGALLVGVLWPSRIVGALDGAPLDRRLEVVVLAVLLPALWYLHPSFLRGRFARAVVGSLAAWKIVAWLLIAQTGWCGLFVSKYEPPIDSYRLERSWDVRTFSTGSPPSCTAIVARPFVSQRDYPAWILNIPFPSNTSLGGRYSLPTENPRPPSGVHAMFLDGWIYPRAAGSLAFDIGTDVRLSGTVDGMPIAAAPGSPVQLALSAGAHAIDLRLDLARTDWQFVPTWDGADLFGAMTTSVTALTPALQAIARWTAWLTPALIVLLLVGWGHAALRALAAPRLVAWVAAAALLSFAIGVMIDRPEVRLVIAALLTTVVVRVPERLRTLRGAFLLFGVPWLAFYCGRAMRDIGRFELYSFGDDWLTFQRHAYRIFMRGYWLEGGEPAFWNQPLYRWTNGVLHLVFGDSSVGELLADAAGLLVGALFAFEIVRRLSTFRVGIAAGVLTLVTIALGPNWYLVGRGLSEVSATAWLYLACFALLRAHGRGWRPAALAGVCAALAFFTRLNYLPLVILLVTLTLPLSCPAGSLARVPHIWRQLPKAPAAAYLFCLMCALAAFSLRTWYYTGAFNPFAGTTLEHNGTGLLAWGSLTSGGAWRSSLESVLMIVTVQDPPRFDVRAVLVVAGVVAAIGGVFNAPLVRRLPLGLSLCCLGAIVGGFVARGVAYPGRFSVHLIPMAVALSMCTIALACERGR